MITPPKNISKSPIKNQNNLQNITINNMMLNFKDVRKYYEKKPQKSIFKDIDE